ncbi:hypothetical protein MKW94_028577 [Papaver nudicaule]|uniref:Uncharacterized protein n=1 Tax=Papaver nudicaule TaxID=74823 RepID=A0AA41S619_PAPNU|nr:hypothetical protein [Papaver nudicaule]
MTLDDIIKISRKTACSNPRKPRVNKRKNVSTAGVSNVWRRDSKPSTKQNKSQKFPTAGARPLRNSTNVWSRLNVSKPPVKQGLSSQRFLNLQSNQIRFIRDVATNMAPAPTRTRPLIRNRMPNLSNSRVPAFAIIFFQEKRLFRLRGCTPLTELKWFSFSNSTSKAGITAVQKRSFPEKKQNAMKRQKQGYSAREFNSFCAYVSERKKAVPHSTDYYEY